jgi:hypothetical protein
MSWVISLSKTTTPSASIAEVLQARGLRVVEARHGAEALQVMRERGSGRR